MAKNLKDLFNKKPKTENSAATGDESSVKTKKKKNPAKTESILAGIMIFCLVCALIVGIVGCLFLKKCIDECAPFNINDFTNVESTKILDSQGEVIADVGSVSRENVPYDEMPQAFIDAIVSVEDSRFFEHNGFDLPRFVKSLLINIKTLSFSQGASTLTMQLVRNVYFTDDTSGRSRVKSLEYKVQQIYLSLLAEKDLNKKRIFELYVNRINFGASTTRGIKGAANYYFGKDVADLSLAECAYLAGVVNAPNTYNAYKHYDKAVERRNTVLDLMAYHGYITEEECKLAKATVLANQLSGVTTSTSKYQAYVNDVVDEVIDLTGLDPYTTTMTIYTYMDRYVQDTIEAIENGETKVKWPDELMQCAIVSVDNHTGAIVGIGGGRGSIVAKGFSRTRDMTKQPGSAVKPFLSYALAFEKLGWSTKHTVQDIPVNYAGSSIQLKNVNREYQGEVLLDYAVGVSLNIPAYLTLYDVINNSGLGSSGVVEYLNSLGFTNITKEKFDLGYAIGGSTFEVTVPQMAAAHGAMVNGGYYVQPHTVSRIEFADGSEPFVPEYTPTRVLSEESAYLVSSLMEQNVTGPYNNYMQVLKRKYEVYAKTGTTNYDDTFVDYGIPAGSAKDKWMICSTGEYTTAVWIGYDVAVDQAETYFTTAKNKLNLPGNVNSLILDALAHDHTPKNVKRPKGISNITFIRGLDESIAPYEGINPEYVVTGMINSKFYPVQSGLVPPAVMGLGDISATLTGISDGKATIHVSFPDYPDPTKLVVNDGTFETILDTKDSKGRRIQVSSVGKKLFDESWVFGCIQYRIMVNGMEIMSSSPVADIQVDLPADGIINVEGSYCYSSHCSQSNVVTKQITMDIDLSSISLYTQAKEMSEKYGLNFVGKPKQVTTQDEKNAENYVYRIYQTSDPSIDLRLTTITSLDQVIGATVEYYYDEEISVNSDSLDSLKNLKEMMEPYGKTINFVKEPIDNADLNGVIKSIRDANDTPVTFTGTTLFTLLNNCTTPTITVTYYEYVEPTVECAVSTVGELKTWGSTNAVTINVEDGINDSESLSSLIVSPSLKSSYKLSELPTSISVTKPAAEPPVEPESPSEE